MICDGQKIEYGVTDKATEACVSKNESPPHSPYPLQSDEIDDSPNDRNNNIKDGDDECRQDEWLLVLLHRNQDQDISSQVTKAPDHRPDSFAFENKTIKTEEILILAWFENLQKSN